jgi:hypothetical protein
MAAPLQIISQQGLGHTAWDQQADTADDPWLWHR